MSKASLAERILYLPRRDVRRVERDRPQAGAVRLQAPDHRVAFAHHREAAAVDVEGEDAHHLGAHVGVVAIERLRAAREAVFDIQEATSGPPAAARV
jgi:hypothetical protein